MKFELTILGSNSALPTSKRFPTAQILNVLERFFLIDCGEGTQIQLKKFRVPMSRINHVFISHLHGDHFFGLIGLISTFSLQGRTNDLHIFAHSKLEKIIRFQLDILESKLSYKLVFHNIFGKEVQTLFEDDALTVQSFPLRHGVMPCAGFLFKEKERPRHLKKDMLDFYKIPIKARHGIKTGDDYLSEEGELIPNSKLTLAASSPRSYAFCTDTAYFPRVVPNIKQVDLLYHEATFLKDDEKRAKSTYHSTAEQAAKIADEAQVGKLLIGHFSARFHDLSAHLNEAKEVFPNTELAEDGCVFEIPLKSTR
ncbi:ribonuclease Z [Ancylomarina euxinus]|uniref:Ribonuclease Z n=1 Tax=Ancylomarina euxinus TaxID=2283627 RepID=A0A425XZB8_9BACT|nr:ribonuclease Z [Ancylomarina euxinus]MCZ4694787.1 ribonuclease Z [Ancylomarina euxinus]MUP15861.1 ribonuclease Z [Ancylomarina euxinus]RRG20559.1 ribonuclease Z [Ancylomarina euxinus]